MYIDKLDDIVNRYNNTYHSTIKMKPVDVKLSIYIYSTKKINDEDHKFKIGDIVRISKHKNIFAKKAMIEIGLNKFLLLQKLKILFRGHMLLVILKLKKFFERFTRKN